MKNKEAKSDSIKIRITPTDKKIITDYCAEQGIEISEFIRSTLLQLIQNNKEI